MKLLVVFNSDPIRAPLSFRADDPLQSHSSIGMRSLTGLILSLMKALQDNGLTEVHLAVNPLHLATRQVQDIERLLDRCPFEAEIIGSDDPSQTLENITNPYSWIKRRDADAVLFVEADCLIARHGVECLIANFQHIKRIYNQDAILAPIDQSELYTATVSSLLVTGASAFWRTIPATRRSFFVSSHVLDLWSLALVDDFTRRLWSASGDEQLAAPLATAAVNCLSPMPGLAASLLSATPPPFVPVSTWYDESTPMTQESATLRIPSGLM